MPDHHNKKKFLNLPKYLGGSKAFKDFIAENLHYPEEAIKANAEGSVIVEYDIHDSGNVSNPRVLKGIGFGCDEEAVRLISLLQFEKVNNRGVRVKLTSKTSINFRLPKASINYTISYVPKTDESKAAAKKKPDAPQAYNYTIPL
jgi:TonB family protein